MCVFVGAEFELGQLFNLEVVRVLEVSLTCISLLYLFLFLTPAT